MRYPTGQLADGLHLLGLGQRGIGHGGVPGGPRRHDKANRAAIALAPCRAQVCFDLAVANAKTQSVDTRAPAGSEHQPRQPAVQLLALLAGDEVAEGPAEDRAALDAKQVAERRVGVIDQSGEIEHRKADRRLGEGARFGGSPAGSRADNKRREIAQVSRPLRLMT